MASFASLVRTIFLAVVAGISFGPAPVALADAPRPLTFAQRVECQRRIERIRWTHRTENVAGRHRPFEEAVPSELIRAKVETYLLQGEALARYWGRPLDGAQLQAEMERMARSTKAPDRLQELHSALDDDPAMIAECLARPVLTDRLIRNRYAYDTRFHGSLRAEAEGAIESAQGSIEALRTMGQTYTEAVWERREVEWEESVIGRLVEEADRFLVHAVLEQSETRLRIATVSWNKRGFDAWWTEARSAANNAVFGALEPVEGGYRRAPITGEACAPDSWIALDPGMPRAREGHTAVWTGTEMIVWGGSYAASELDTGSRYDPATDSWTPTSTGGNVPAARVGHTAVWTGTEMIVWGGYAIQGGLDFNSGGRYDPATDSWAPTTGADVPAARVGHTAVWTGTEMIVWGGKPFQGETAFSSGGRYDPATDSWTPTTGADVPAARVGHTAVWTGNAMIVWGGNDGTGNDADPPIYFDTGGRYDPTADSWSATSVGTGVPDARDRHTAVWTGTEMIVWGGSESVNPSIVLDTGGRYDPAGDLWFPTSLDNAADARLGHTAVWSGTEMIVWGGHDGFGTVDTGGRYDPATDGWSATGTGAGVPDARYGHAAVWTGTEMIVWGGWPFPATGGRYDPVSDGWTSTSTGADMPTPRARHLAVWTGAEMIVWGGASSPTGGRYDPATDSWSATTTAGAPVPGSGNSAVWTGTEMIVWGGYDWPDFFDTGGRYDPVTDSWSATSTVGDVPAGRRRHTAVWSGTEMIVWGGNNHDPPNHLLTGGRYDPATDSWSTTTIGGHVPAGRYDHTAVWAGTEMIVWGGRRDSSGLNTGGRYDPTTDSWIATGTGANLPTERFDHSAVWTGTEMIVWGGGDSASLFNTGGRYDPATDGWNATGIGSAVPVPRTRHAAVWSGTEMVVWGGGDWPDFFNTGGRYHPSTDSWTSTSTDAGVPADRRDHTAVWTGTTMIVWGGSDEVGPTNTGGRYCGCATVAPTATLTLVASKTGTDVSFDWSPVAMATGYDAVKGRLGVLRSTAGNFLIATTECLGNDLQAGPVGDDQMPQPGNALWYLVRAVSCGGPGSYDSDGGGQVALRDSQIAFSAGACP